MQAIFETVFDAAYLLTVLLIGIRMLWSSHGVRIFQLFGAMAIVLGAGDAFHLIPRAIALCTTGLSSYTVALGIGKMITSVTMTVFYILLYCVWRARYDVKGRDGYTAAIAVLAAIRIALCLMPQNGWTSATPSLAWGVFRNIPFTIMGILIVGLFYRSAKKRTDMAFRRMWLTIVISFACYLPVVLFADRFAWVGFLMIPKTLAYVWTVLIGYRAMRNEAAG